jgi:Flp pilus assembly pilin Flp
MLYQLSYVRARKKGSAPSLQQGIAQDRPQADDSTVRTLLDLRNEHGQTVAEYSVILAVITPAIVLVLSLLSGRVAGFFTAFASIIP